MKIFRLLIIAALLLPMTINAQSRRGNSAKKVVATSEVAKYPRYNDSEAAELWLKWKRHESFSQENYARVIDLCDASFEYLSAEIRIIMSSTASQSQRKKKALDLDMGITSNMSNFARTFAIRMQNLAAKGQLTPENTNSVAQMLQKKKQYMELNQLMFHPN